MRLDYKLFGYIVIVVCLIIIVSVYIVTIYKNRKLSSSEIYQKLFVDNPRAISFSIGKQSDGTYLNVYLNEDGTTEERYETYPIDEAGNPIFLKSHGDLTETDEGYTISGIDFTFTCPEGYSGVTCEPTPPCNNENGIIKPITYTLFNSLGLNKNQFDYSNPLKRSVFDEPINNRLYITCKTGTDYEINSCEPNEVLDVDEIKKGKAVCISYDICQEQMNGYIHNYDPKGAELENNQYFVCQNGVSEEKTCDDGYVFSRPNYSCLANNRCFNNEGAKFKQDENSYIICVNDIEKVITCSEKVDDTGVNCISSICKPSTTYMNCDLFDYTQGVVNCVDNKEVVVDCTSEEKTLSIFKNDFMYPSKIYDKETNACIDVTDPLALKTKDIYVNYNNLLTSSYLYTGTAYDCTGTENLIGTIYYDQNVVITPSGEKEDLVKYKLEPPCVTEEANHNFPTLLNFQLDPETLSFTTDFGENINKDYPILTKNSDGNYVYNEFVDYDIINTYISKTPPLGFNDDCSYVIPGTGLIRVTSASKWSYTPVYRDESDLISTTKTTISSNSIDKNTKHILLPYANGKSTDDSDSDYTISYTPSIINIKPKSGDVGNLSFVRNALGMDMEDGKYLNIQLIKGDQVIRLEEVKN